MLDLAQVVGFDWDDGNSEKSLTRHGVSQKEAEQVFDDPRLLVLTDTKHSVTEDRFHAFGETGARRKLQLSFTLREDSTLIRVISARDMSRRERARYDEEA
jgi:uncharacterized DUF497 family protein